jgi:hypothetical protein
VQLGLLRLNFGAKEWAVITGRLLMGFASDWKIEAVYVKTISVLFKQLITIYLEICTVRLTMNLINLLCRKYISPT